MRQDRRFGHLRSLLHDAPSASGWRAICHLIDRAAQEDADATPLVDYAQEALDRRWPDALRVAPRGCPYEPPVWPLVRALDVCPSAAHTAHIDADGGFERVRHLTLDQARRVSAEALRALLDARSLDLIRFDYAASLQPSETPPADAFAPLWTRHTGITHLRIAPAPKTLLTLDLEGPIARPALEALDLGRCLLSTRAGRALLSSDLPALRDLSIWLMSEEPAALRSSALLRRPQRLALRFNGAHLLDALAPLVDEPPRERLELRGISGDILRTADSVQHIIALPPPDTLRLTHVTMAEQAAQVMAQRGWLNRCRVVHLHEPLAYAYSLYPAAQALLTSIRDVEELTLSRSFMPDTIATLCTSPWPRLTTLRLKGCGMMPEDTSRFIAAFPLLELLHLEECHQAPLHALADAPWLTNLRELSLLNTSSTPESLGRMIDALRDHPRMERLNLTSTHLLGAHISQLAQASLPALAELRLGRVQELTTEALDALAAAPWMAQLKTLQLDLSPGPDLKRLRARIDNPTLRLVQ